MQDFLNKKMVVGVSGGIAAYKTALLVRELTRLGAVVRVVMTASAQQFITPMTFQALSGQDVRCDLFDAEAERAMGHIELARWADYLVIAPASANCLAKMAHGLADDLLSTLYLVFETPVVICPAMNRSMWAHPATTTNVDILTSRGALIVGPEEGSQACGEYGLGRMSDVDAIVNALRLLDVGPVLRGRRLLITAGTTREPIDPVRYISNRSSGKMGYALAEAARMAGAEVILVSGPTTLPAPQGVTTHCVNTAIEMCDAVMRNLEPGMIFVGAAAVADFTLAAPSGQKMKRQGREAMTLELVATPDIVATVVASQKAAYTVAFAAETHDVAQHAQLKLHAKQVDMVVANQVGEGLGFDTDDNQVLVLTQERSVELPRLHKVRLAAQIMNILAEQCHARESFFLKE